jgi:hypothetical protein
MATRKSAHPAPNGGSLRVRTSLEDILACLQEHTDNDEVVVAALAKLMKQGRLRRPPIAFRARQEKAA